MTSGGARARSGPPPDPDAIRRDRGTDQAWLTLPASRPGDPPPWPLSESTKREDALWAQLWAMPQATQWETLKLTDEVALYVRTFCEAAQPEANSNTRTLVLRLREGLGLSTAGLARNRWRIAGATDTQQETKRADGNRRTSSKDRFAVIEGRKSA